MHPLCCEAWRNAPAQFKEELEKDLELRIEKK
jgi:hypothetical protein